MLVAGLVGVVTLIGAHLLRMEYALYAGYIVVQYVTVATAWNILGGYCGYVNFGSAAFFATGVYSTIFFLQFVDLPLPLLMVLGGIVAGLIGLGMGYLTLRLKGAFFAIGTLALAVVLQTLVMNWDLVGGSRGTFVIRPQTLAFGTVSIGYMDYLFALMLVLAIGAIVTARWIERSRMGLGFATIRDDEAAAEACGVPTLRLKLMATTISGGLMGMAGAPYPFYIGYVQPHSAFGLEYGVNAIAMSMIGGTSNWTGPLVGALLLGTTQQLATVTISSAVNLLIVGLMLVGFVIIAPKGIIGLVQGMARKRESRS
ncbi:branched-chain amino acid ABC transporter permease [Aquabacter sp. P-9]|uniref:branched-chain amino acid ABC transporter permease n=1 Tax=Aquabacter sediminis TaxID=3029197 RepID=UPI00237E518E|nr:branched-chain amino acid ABC transporter permease [Aquabacter sp. P-9]MDE1571141.1 branched-chain amino acid ABC transporter permease [Aquabacter sp. P-9]